MLSSAGVNSREGELRDARLDHPGAAAVVLWPDVVGHGPGTQQVYLGGSSKATLYTSMSLNVLQTSTSKHGSVFNGQIHVFERRYEI